MMRIGRRARVGFAMAMVAMAAAASGCNSETDAAPPAAPPVPAPPPPQPVPDPACREHAAIMTGQHGYAWTVAEEPVGFLLFLPAEYDRQDRWPLILFLHGSQERGTDLSVLLRHGPPSMVMTRPDFPFIVLSPQQRGAGGWSPALLNALLDRVVCGYKVDRSRIYVTGLSLGGFGTWSLAINAPTRFAAIAPVSGSGDPAGARALATLPIWAFHGQYDDRVPLAGAQAMVDAARAAGNTNVRFTVYPDRGHDVWDNAYGPALYDWFLEWRSPTE